VFTVLDYSLCFYGVFFFFKETYPIIVFMKVTADSSDNSNKFSSIQTVSFTCMRQVKNCARTSMYLL